MSYVIMTDSSSDLPWGYYSEHNISYLPLHVTMDGKTFPDNGAMEPKAFFDSLRHGMVATTSQISLSQFVAEFTTHLKEGKDIIYIGLNAALSGSHDIANMAKKEVLELYPEGRIYTGQTSCVSLGLGLLVHEACKRRDEGMDYDSLCAWVDENKLNVHHKFTVDDLMFLHRGGRVSRVSAVVGSLLGVKPMLHVGTEGHLLPHNKVRGRKQSIVALFNEMLEETETRDLSTVAISHGDCLDEAEYLMGMIREKFNVEDTIINQLGMTIGAHAGPGTMALFFMGKTRTK